MPEDCGCGQGGSKKETLTRREFIKTSGVVAAGAVLAAVPLRIIRPPGLPLASVDADTIKLALLIAAADPMFQEADAEVQTLGLKLDTAFESVKFSDSEGARVGVVIPHLVSPSYRMGVDVALTVDFNAGFLASVHYLIAWSLVSLLNVASVSLDYRDLPSPVSEDTGPSSIQPPQIVRPRVENHWGFMRSNSPEAKDIDRVAAGWPLHAEDPAAGYWHYGGCTQAGWLDDRGEQVFRCLQVKETLPALPDLSASMPLS